MSKIHTETLIKWGARGYCEMVFCNEWQSSRKYVTRINQRFHKQEGFIMVCPRCRKRRNQTAPPFNPPNIDFGSQATYNHPYTDFVDYMQDSRQIGNPKSRMIPMKRCSVPAMHPRSNYDDRVPEMYTRKNSK